MLEGEMTAKRWTDGLVSPQWSRPGRALASTTGSWAGRGCGCGCRRRPPSSPTRAVSPNTSFATTTSSGMSRYWNTDCCLAFWRVPSISVSLRLSASLSVPFGSVCVCARARACVYMYRILRACLCPPVCVAVCLASSPLQNNNSNNKQTTVWINLCTVWCESVVCAVCVMSVLYLLCYVSSAWYVSVVLLSAVHCLLCLIRCLVCVRCCWCKSSVFFSIFTPRWPWCNPLWLTGLKAPTN